MADQVVLTENESSRVNWAADRLGVSRQELVIKVCQLKSFLASKQTAAAELKASVALNVREHFTNASSAAKLIYGICGIVGIAFGVKLAATGVGVALMVIGAVLLFTGLKELFRVLDAAWQSLRAQIDAVMA